MKEVVLKVRKAENGFIVAEGGAYDAARDRSAPVKEHIASDSWDDLIEVINCVLSGAL